MDSFMFEFISLRIVWMFSASIFEQYFLPNPSLHPVNTYLILLLNITGAWTKGIYSAFEANQG